MFQFPKRHSVLATVALICATSLASMAIAKETIIQMPMAADATTNGIKSSKGGSISVAAMVFDYKGKAMICGFWTEGTRITAGSKALESFRKTMETSSVRYKNKVLVRNLTFMNEVTEKEWHRDTKANCKLSKRKWNPAMTNESINIHVMRRTIH